MSSGPERTGVYRFTSIARPIDPSYLTNKALLYILPVVALVNALLAVVTDLGVAPLTSALNGVLVALVAWALTRELAPDFVEAAFVALVIAWLANLAFGTSQVLPVFATIVLLRVVNRSTGLPLTWFDTVSVFGFCSYMAMQAQQPIVVLVLALVFVLDAVLEHPLRRHFLAAVVCLPVFAWMVYANSGFDMAQLTDRDWLMIGFFVLGAGLLVATSEEPISYADTSYTRLHKARVNAGVLVGLLMGLQALVSAGPVAWFETPIWMCLAAVLMSLVGRRVLDLKNRIGRIR